MPPEDREDKCVSFSPLVLVVLAEVVLLCVLLDRREVAEFLDLTAILFRTLDVLPFAREYNPLDGWCVDSCDLCLRSGGRLVSKLELRGVFGGA